MNMLRYAACHLRRCPRETLTVLLSYFMVLVLIMSAQASSLSRQQMITDMAEHLPVTATLSAPQGTRTSNLQILNSDLSPYKANGRWEKYVGELHIGASYGSAMLGRSEFVDEDGVTRDACKAFTDIIGINSDKSDAALENADIAYAGGYDGSIWATSEPVALITEDVEHAVETREDGTRWIDVTIRVTQYSPGGSETDLVEMDLQVIGVVDAKKTVYCPFDLLKAELRRQAYYTLNTDRLSFTFSDNALIDEFRDAAKNIYVEPDRLNPNFNFRLGLIIKDARYLQLIQEAEKNLAIFRLMQPVLYLCAIGAGMLLMVMQLRARKREMAIIRSVGCGVWRVLMQCLLEYALICLPVTVLSPFIWQEMPLAMALAVFAAFMTGAVLTILRFACIPLGRQIRALED